MPRRELVAENGPGHKDRAYQVETQTRRDETTQGASAPEREQEVSVQEVAEPPGTSRTEKPSRNPLQAAHDPRERSVQGLEDAPKLCEAHVALHHDPREVVCCIQSGGCSLVRARSGLVARFDGQLSHPAIDASAREAEMIDGPAEDLFETFLRFREFEAYVLVG